MEVRLKVEIGKYDSFSAKAIIFGAFLLYISSFSSRRPFIISQSSSSRLSSFCFGRSRVHVFTIHFTNTSKTRQDIQYNTVQYKNFQMFGRQSRMTTASQEKDGPPSTPRGTSTDEARIPDTLQSTPLESSSNSTKDIIIESDDEYPSGFRLAFIVVALILSIFLVSHTPLPQQNDQHKETNLDPVVH